MASTESASKIPFNVADAVEHYFDRPDEPQTIHLELHLDGVRLDRERFDAAWRSAVAPHPLARVRAVNDWAGPAWVVRAPEEAPPLVTDSTASVDVVRAEAVNRRVDLAASPLRVTRVLGAGGDAVVIAINHAAMDGVSAVGLLRAASSAYEGRQQAPRGPDALDVHDLRRFAPSSLTLPSLPRSPLRVRPAPGARPGAGGYEVCMRAMRPPASPAGTGATVNDMLLAALHLCLDRWIGARSGDIAVMMPINLRPSEWREDVVGNLSLMAPVCSTAADRRRPDRLVAAVARQTTRIKRNGSHRSMAMLPSVLQRNAGWLARLAGERTRDTAILSNLGRIDPPGFGGAGELWFSPPAAMPTGLAVGAVTARGRLHLGFRGRRCLMCADDLARFADGLVGAVDDVVQSVAGRASTTLA